jgi:hypothetical protein
MPLDEIYLAKSSNIASRMLGDEAIIMSTVDSTLFTLSQTGTVIWEAADGQTPLSRIIEERVCGQFNVTVEQAKVDAKEFVAKLVEHGLLIVSDQPIVQ